MIRAFIGSEPKTKIMEQVLIHSIRTRVSEPVDFTVMVGPAWEYPTDKVKVGTGFSLRRWLIPYACGWRGLAIYMDADQLVLGDLAELAHAGQKAMAAADSCVATTYQPDKFNKNPWPQTSVMVIDCEKAKDEWGFHKDKMLKWLEEHGTKQYYAEFMHATWLKKQPGILPVEWNHLNVYKNDKTRLLHYTTEGKQPPQDPAHPLADLWRAEMVSAIKAGCITKADFEYALSQWGNKVDWRPTNGLNPFYRKYLSMFD